MDDFRLKVFITAARTLSFTRTAEQLCISQPAVSKHVGELESRYEVQLFTRRGSRLELTEAGRTLLASAERVADDYRRFVNVRIVAVGNILDGGIRKVGAAAVGGNVIAGLEYFNKLRQFLFSTGCCL